MMKLHKKYQAAKLVLPIAGSVLVSGAVSQLPPRPIEDGLRLLAGTASLLATGKAWCDATELEGMEAQNTADDAVRAAAIEADARCNAAYYRRHPNHFRANKPVPEEWRQAWAATGGNPALLHRAIAPSTLVQPIAPIAQPQPQPQAQAIQQPGQVRGGSFDRAAASESPGSGWGDFDPRPIPPIAQTPIAPIAQIAQPQEWEPDAVDLYAPDESWIDSLLRPSVLLVYGSDGSGKTTVACELIARRQAANHQTFALDPHSHPGKWGNCEVIGAGMGHKAIAAFIARLQAIITDRYERISKGEVAPGAFQPISIVCEELTDWAGEVSNSDLLLAKAGHYRKANVHLILVSHGDKLGQLGAPKGFADMANRILTKLKLESKPGADGEPIPAMKGLLTQPNGQPVPVVIPRFAKHQPERPSQNPETFAVQTIRPDVADHFGFRETPETTPKRPETMALPPAETRNTDEPPKGAECRDLFFRLKDLGLNQTQIIKAIWGATPGDSPQYKMARDFYKLLNSQYLEETGNNAA